WSAECLACIAGGLNRYNLHAETVDGNDPLAVIDAFRRKIAVLRSGEGPVLLEIQAYRQSGHSPSDASAYREREEIQLWREVDPILEYGNKLVAAEVASEGDLARIREDALRRLKRICALAVDLEVS